MCLIVPAEVGPASRQIIAADNLQNGATGTARAEIGAAAAANSDGTTTTDVGGTSDAMTTTDATTTISGIGNARVTGVTAETGIRVIGTEEIFPGPGMSNEDIFEHSAFLYRFVMLRSVCIAKEVVFEKLKFRICLLLLISATQKSQGECFARRNSLV